MPLPCSSALSVTAMTAVLALSACMTSPAPTATSPRLDGPVCAFAEVTFDAAIPSGRLSACRQDGPSAYTLFIRPENAPINPSPWYAFEVETTVARPLELTLAYEEGEHRYDPLISTDRRTYAPLADPAESEGGRLARFSANIPAGRSLISAQPLFTLSDVDTLLDGLSKATGAPVITLGQSEQGRDIRAIRFGAGTDTGMGPDTGRDTGETLLLIGGQHPAETRGAIAMAAFVIRLTEDDPLARAFRDRFGVALIAAINPDGIEAGHWRNNTRGVDLNRDWGQFTQAETQAVRDWLPALMPLAVVLDFHGTRRDVLYTQPDGASGRRPGFAGALKAGLDARFGETAPARQGSHTPGSPVAKNWFHETFAVPALTYEVGDRTPTDDVIATARAAAEITMQFLLDTPR